MNKVLKGALVLFGVYVGWQAIDEDPVGSGNLVNEVANGVLDGADSLVSFVTALDLPQFIDRLVPDAQAAPSFQVSDAASENAIVLAEESDSWTFPEAGSISHRELTQSLSIADGFARDTLSPVTRNF